MKSNISEDQGGLAFALTRRHGLPSGMPHIEYEADPVTDTNADDALSPEPRKRGPEPEAESAAADYLQLALSDGPRPAKELIEEAREVHAVSKRTLDRAKVNLGVIAFRKSNPGPWWWRLPGGHIANHLENGLEGEVLGNLGNVPEMPSEVHVNGGADCHIAKYSLYPGKRGGLPEGDTF